MTYIDPRSGASGHEPPVPGSQGTVPVSLEDLTLLRRDREELYKACAAVGQLDPGGEKVGHAMLLLAEYVLAALSGEPAVAGTSSTLEEVNKVFSAINRTDDAEPPVVMGGEPYFRSVYPILLEAHHCLFDTHDLDGGARKLEEAIRYSLDFSRAPKRRHEYFDIPQIDGDQPE